jgi:hypothetical protein
MCLVFILAKVQVRQFATVCFNALLKFQNLWAALHLKVRHSLLPVPAVIGQRQISHVAPEKVG